VNTSVAVAVDVRKRLLFKRGDRWRKHASISECAAPMKGDKSGGTKAPAIKTFDANRSYVQRATTEQFVGNYKKRPPK
jgi:hypothetical protein